MKYNTNLNKYSVNSRIIPIFKYPINLHSHNTRLFNGFKKYFSINNIKFNSKINDNNNDNKNILKSNLNSLFLESISNLINNKNLDKRKVQSIIEKDWVNIAKKIIIKINSMII